MDDLIEKNEEIIEKIKKYGNLLYKSIKCSNWINILDIISFDKGTEIGSKNYIEKQDNESIPYIRVGNLLNNQYDTFCYDDNYKTCDIDDILIAFDGAPGRNSIGLEGAYSSGTYKINCENKIKGYIYFYLNSDICQNIIKENSEGTTILHASKSIKLLKIQNLDDEKQLELFNLLFEKLVSLYKKQKYLKNIKQLLLNKYFD